MFLLVGENRFYSESFQLTFNLLLPEPEMSGRIKVVSCHKNLLKFVTGLQAVFKPDDFFFRCVDKFHVQFPPLSVVVQPDRLQYPAKFAAELDGWFH